MNRTLSARIGITVSVIVLLVLVIAPFYWIFTSSIKTTQEILSSTPSFLPQTFTLQHYDKLLASSNFPRYLVNSAVVAVMTMVITVILSVMASYAIYRLEFPGRRWLVRVILATYIFPGILLLIPLYGMLSQLKLIDSLWALVIINVTFASPFAVWMLQAFFQAIPYEVEEAAALDGASRVTIILKIFLPLTAPGIASIAIYAFISACQPHASGRVGRHHRPISSRLGSAAGRRHCHHPSGADPVQFRRPQLHRRADRRRNQVIAKST
jgi:ABC-type glycerol-3-phosphate transport system permease component